MNYYLITHNYNWADEADFEGFDLLSEDEYNKIHNRLNNTDERKRITFYFGTNEDDEYSIKEIKDGMAGVKLTEDEAEVIKKIFGTQFGFSPLDSIEDNLEDNEE